jgi:two-component system NtrC family sensor kinase
MNASANRTTVTQIKEIRKARILTVDDDRTTLAMLAITIGRAGYDIVQASSAEEALDMIAESQPDLAVLDVSMPGMSGIELAQRLRAETAIPFMFLSTHTESDIVREAAGQGAIGYLVKPVDFSRVVSVIEAGLAHAHALKQLKKSETRLRNEHASRAQRQADLIGRYAELTDVEIRLQQVQARSLQRSDSHAHDETRVLEDIIESLYRIIDAYRDINTSPMLDAQARARLAAIRSKLVLGLLDRDSHALQDKCREANRRMCSIVRALKEVSLADGATQGQRNHLHALLDAALETACGRIGSMAAVRKEYGELPPMACPPAQLGQVFMHLFVNAAEAVADCEQAMIGVRTGIVDDRLWVEISDNGRGIAPENHELIFDPFFTTKPPGAGLGLGLSISREIVQKHGGDIQVSSKFGEGSMFRVMLPQASLRIDGAVTSSP